MPARVYALSFLLLAACKTPLPPAAVIGQHGLERLWIESLGME
ncbi:MAG TPA: hypothetical protein VFD82_13315 [Planctomycetota bacterium]|nr:hypothetical protein [Planctomycetota bacterium]